MIFHRNRQKDIKAGARIAALSVIMGGGTIGKRTHLLRAA